MDGFRPRTKIARSGVSSDQAGVGGLRDTGLAGEKSVIHVRAVMPVAVE